MHVERRLQRAFKAAQVEPSGGVAHAGAPGDGLRDGLCIGHARHALGVHKRHRLHIGKARVCQGLDEADFVRRRNRQRLDLETLSRAFLVKMNVLGPIAQVA